MEKLEKQQRLKDRLAYLMSVKDDILDSLATGVVEYEVDNLKVRKESAATRISEINKEISAIKTALANQKEKRYIF